MSMVEAKVPTIGESVTEVTLSKWLKPNGAYVQIDEPICEFESDKATLEFPAEAAGILTHVASEGQDLEIGALVARIDTAAAKSEGAPVSSEKQTASAPAVSGAQATKPAGDTYASGHPSPAAAKILKEAGVSPAEVTGSGRDGRITRNDAVQAAELKANTPTPISPVSSAGQASPVQKPAVEAFSRGEERKKMSRMRRTIAARLVKAKNETAMLTTFNEVDLSEVMALRSKYNERFEKKYGIKIGFMSLFAKACAKALPQNPKTP